MSRSDSKNDAAFDAQMRAVPLPEGFVERLRQAAITDAELDSVVRAIPVPPGLLDRIRQSLLSDEELDLIVRNVPIPAGMLNRVRKAAIAEPAPIAEEDLPRPLRLPERLRHRVGKRSGFKRASQWAAALSLLAALGFGYIGIMAGLLISTKTNRTLPSVAQAEKPVEEREVFTSEPLVFGAPPPAPLEQYPGVPEFEPSSTPSPMLRFSPETLGRSSWLSEMDEKFGPGSPNPFADALSRRWGGVFTSHHPFDELPELKKASRLNPQGIMWPLVPGANSVFLIRYGMHPFVIPAMHPQLRTTTVPLGVDTSSYELTRRWLEDGMLPPPDQLRTEEFLAAVDYDFPRPTDQPLGLSVAAGPSPLNVPGLQLLQVGVQAAAFRDVDRPGGRLVLAVDVSASMRWGGRIDMIRDALRKLIRQIGRNDRLSLVAFSEGSEVLIEDAGAEDVSPFLAALRSLRIRSSTNVGAGLCQAYAVAEEIATESKTPVRVVLLTDGLAELDRPTAERIEKQLAAAVPQQIYLDVVDLGQEKAADPQLASFAQAGRGELLHAASADQVRWALLKTLTGRSQTVAGGVSLKVTFDPNTVAAYRLFGHEAKAVAGVLPDRSQTDFHADQSGTALYELQLKPAGGDNIGSVELSWQPLEGGPRRTVVRPITRSEFATAFLASAPALQEAAVAAGVAEVLRESPFVRVPSHIVSLGRILELAGQADSRLQQRPSFADFLVTVQQAMRAKPYRGGGRR